MKKFFAWKPCIISCVIGSAIMSLSFLDNHPPQLDNYVIRSDNENRQWAVSGVCRFTAGPVARVWSERYYALSRKGKFSLSVKYDGSSSIGLAKFEKEAVQQARKNAGEWNINFVVVLLTFVITGLIVRFAWWGFETYRKKGRVPVKQPEN